MRSFFQIQFLLKLFLLALMSLFFGLLMVKTARFNDSSLSVTIEFKGKTTDLLHVFYSANSIFTEKNSVFVKYVGSDEFRTIKVDLPNQKIDRLRIDPGGKTKRYAIRRIEIEKGTKKFTFKGKEILQHFQLRNLDVVENGNSHILVLTQAEKPDVQMFYNDSLIEEFRLLEQLQSNKIQTFIIIIYVLFVILIISYGNKIFSWIRDKAVPPGYKISNQRIISICLYLTSVILKIVLVSVQQMTALTSARWDDALFIKLGYSIRYGNWLGDYNSLTLAKGFGYPLFIATINFLGISLFFAQHLLYALAVYVMVRALAPFLKSRNWEFVLFLILLFNPVISSSIFTRILRDELYFSLTLFVVAGFIGLFLRGKSGYGHLTGWAILSGIMLFFHQNTREEGITLMPFLIVLSILSLIPVFRKPAYNVCLPNSESIFKDRTFRVSVILLPYIFLIAGNIVLAYTNYLVYGGFVRNEIKSEAFRKAYAALSKIETDYWSINVPVPIEARMKAYEVSSTFSELKPFLENKNNGWKKYGTGDPEEIKGGWFLWAFRNAAQKAGWHKSLPHSQKLYMKVAEEIDAAFEKGLLRKKNNFSLFSFTWDNRFFPATLSKFCEIVPFVVKFEKYNPYPKISKGDPKEIAKFQDITNEIANISTIDEMNQIPSTRLKYWLLTFIGWIYGLVNPLVFVVSFVFYLAALISLLFKNIRPLILEAWIIASILIFIVFTRIVLIAFISVSQWEAVNMLYLGQLYPFMLAFEFIVIYASVKMFRNIFIHKKVLIKS